MVLTDVKWVLAIVVLAVAAGAVAAWGVARARRPAGAPAAGPLAERRLRAWARALGWNLLALGSSIAVLAMLAGLRTNPWWIALAAVFFGVAGDRFNAILEQRRRTDERQDSCAVVSRLIIGTSLLLAGATLAVDSPHVTGRHGVGFAGLVIALFGASSLLAELRWAEATWRRGTTLVLLAVSAVAAVVALWLPEPYAALVVLAAAVFGTGVVGLSCGAEDLLRWFTVPQELRPEPTGARRLTEAIRTYPTTTLLGAGIVLSIVATV